MTVGLLLLVKGSDYFISSVSRIAQRLGVSEFVIGLTLVAVGTSLPELAYAIYSSSKHEGGLIIGNVIGANIANLSLIVGIAAVIKPIKIDEEMLERDGYFVLAVSILLVIANFDGIVSRIESVVFITIFFGYTVFLFETKPEYKGRFGFLKFARYFTRFGYFGTLAGIFKKVPTLDNKSTLSIVPGSLLKDLCMASVGVLLVVFGAKLLVDNAIYFANYFNASAAVLGILIAIGTTLPELSVGISAARKGLGNIVIGNIIGSCITNTLFILSASSLIYPVKSGVISQQITIPIFVLLVILILFFIKKHGGINRREGFVLTMMYMFFAAIIFIYGFVI